MMQGSTDLKQNYSVTVLEIVQSPSIKLCISKFWEGMQLFTW